MNSLGKYLVAIGLIIAILGLVTIIFSCFNPLARVSYPPAADEQRFGESAETNGKTEKGSAGPRIPFLGRLPGDVVIRKENFTLYFPLATSLLVSVVLSVVLYFVLRSHKWFGS